MNKWQPPILGFPLPRWEPPPYLQPAPPPYSGGPTIELTAETLADVPRSSIDIAGIIAAKFSPASSALPPPVAHMTYTFGDPLDDDDHTVRLYLALSQEERIIVKKHGLNEEAFDEVSLLSDEELAGIQQQQERELSNTLNSHDRASLGIEHQQQITMFQKKITIMLEHLLQYPYERKFSTRLQATKYRQKLEGQLQSLKKRLEEYRGK